MTQKHWSKASKAWHSFVFCKKNKQINCTTHDIFSVFGTYPTTRKSQVIKMKFYFEKSSHSKLDWFFLQK